MIYRLLIVLFLFLSTLTNAQELRIRGKVVDVETKEPIGYASVYLMEKGYGETADSIGSFSILINMFLPDTLLISRSGYLLKKISISSIIDSPQLVINMFRIPQGAGVVINTKLNKGLFLWKKIMARKELYNTEKYFNYSFEEYTKLNFDLKNLNIDKLKDNLLFKPFSFIINPIAAMRDTAGNLPGYLMETMSDYAYQQSPKKIYEYIKANNSHGFLTPNTYNMLSLFKQKLNIYDNFIRILNKDFIGPFYDHADNYYNFSVPDTQILEGKKYLHFVFKPKHSGLNGFDGDAWVKTGNYELRSATLYLNPNAGSFIDAMSFYQEFTNLSDSLPFVKRSNVSAEFRLMGKKSITVTGTQSTSYNNIVVNSDSITQIFNKQELAELVTHAPSYMVKNDTMWNRIRPDSLSYTEKRNYYVIDSFVASPNYARVQRNFKFLGSGYWETGNIDLGKWYNLISGNQWEGTRIRFDLATNLYFNRNFFLHGYGAYGTLDKKFKGLAEAYWVANREPTFVRFHALYKQDVDNNVHQYGEIGDDNIFSVAIRKPNSTRKFLSVKDLRFESYIRWKSGLSFELLAARQEYRPLQNLPSEKSFTSLVGKPLNNFSLSLKMRFAYLEKYLIGDYFKYSLETKYPVVTVMAEKGFPNVLQSAYSYFKIAASVRDDISIAPLGRVSLDVFAGKIYGNLPFTLLENHPGNDLYYYNDRLFNMMNRFEYLSDQYAGFHFQHNLGWSIFRVFPVMRKLKWSQFWTANGLWGSLGKANNDLNQADLYFKTLNGRSYFEVGTGLDNIFKFFRIDCIWRVLPNPLPVEKKYSFGVFGSFQFKI